MATDGLRQTLVLDERLARMKHVFRAPPLTNELVGAIRLLAPHLRLGTTERERRFWESDQNGACWGEYEVLAPILSALPADARVLDIGPGLGRSVVFFSRMRPEARWDWHLYDGTGTTTRYARLGPRDSQSFCGNLALLKDTLAYNGIGAVTIWDAATSPLRSLPAPFDLIYSFYSVGFHWAIEDFLEDLDALLDRGGIGIFTVPLEYRTSRALDRWNARLLPLKAVWPRDQWHQLLVLTKEV